jgi:hypothetical protein
MIGEGAGIPRRVDEEQAVPFRRGELDEAVVGGVEPVERVESGSPPQCPVELVRP